MIKDKIILGIDPGTSVMGFGLIHIKNDKIKLLLLDVLLMQKIPNHNIKLKKIFKRTISIIDEFKPDEIAIEAPFFGKNVQSMLKLGRAQGVAMAAALLRDIPVTEYSPKKIKQAITGNGNASKEQVSKMLKQTIQFDDQPKYLDATDGLAAAVCHYFQKDISNNQKKYSNWENFLKKNPGRLS